MHDGHQKAEGGGELKIEFDGIKSEEPVLHMEILVPQLETDPASGPDNIAWSQERKEFYNGPFKSNVEQLETEDKELIGVAVTNVLPVIELDKTLKPVDIQITEKIVNGKKRYLGQIPIKGIVRDVLANIHLDAKIKFVSAANWNDQKNEMERLTIELDVKPEKISPAKPVGHTSVFNRSLKYELRHGKNYIRVVTGRNALGASNDAFYLIEATEKVIDISLGTSELILDKVTVLNPESTIQWSPYFANIRSGLMNEGAIPEKITVGNANMKTDHLYDVVNDGLNFKKSKNNNWSSKVFTLLPFEALTPNTDYDAPLGEKLDSDNGFIFHSSSAPFAVNTSEIASNKAEVFSVDLAIEGLKPEDEADKGYYIRKTLNESKPNSDCQPEYPVMIDLKSSEIVQKLLADNKGELKLEIIKSKRTPTVSISVNLANGKKTVDGSIILEEANQQIEILGLENGVADLKLSYTYKEFYTQDIIRFVVCSLDFIQPHSIEMQLPQKIFDPKPFLKITNITFDKVTQKVTGCIRLMM